MSFEHSAKCDKPVEEEFDIEEQQSQDKYTTGEYKCKEGYHSKDGSDGIKLVCEDGKWSPEGKCVKGSLL